MRRTSSSPRRWSLIAAARTLIAVAYLISVAPAAFAQSASQSTLGLVYSSANPDAQSLIGIYNGTSSTDWANSGATVTLTLRDGATGAMVGQWQSPSLRAGVAQQFAISDIESGLTPGVAKPATYAITAQGSRSGMAVQHVVLRNGLLSNMTDCDTGVVFPTNGKALLNVRASTSAAYQGTVVVTNTNSKSLGLTIEIYDANAGYFMGSFPTPIIPAGGHVIMSVAAMEAAAHITATKYTPSYVVRFGHSSDGGYNFVGFLQYLVNNTATGAITDLTAVCPVGGAEPVHSGPDASVHTGPIFSSANSSGQSYLQVANTGTAAGTVTLTLSDPTAGTAYGTWTSPSIPSGAAREFAISEIEGSVSVPATKPAFYGLKVQSTIAGEIQHVLRGTAGLTPTDLSTCDFGTGASMSRLNGVHSSQLNGTFPSTVVVTNTGTTAAPVTLALYDAATGTRLGAATTPSIPAGGQLSLSSLALESAAQVSPNASQTRYNVAVEGAFTGVLQHLIANASTGAVTDLTIACQLQLPQAPIDQPFGATLADVPAGVDLRNLPDGIDLSRLSQGLRDYILSLQQF